MKVESPLVSIVVTTKNESTNIDSCLRSIHGQSYENIEIIVVDNFSTDETKSIAKKYTSHIYDYGPERSAQRNHGLLKLAKGTFAMYIDADMILSPSLIESCVIAVKCEPALSLYLPEVILGRSFFNSIRRFEREYYEGTPIDAVRFFPLDSFIKVGGFDEELFKDGSGEDWDLDKSLRSVTSFGFLEKKESIFVMEPKLLALLHQMLPKKQFAKYTSRVCIFHNESDVTFRKFVKKKIYYARAFERYKNKWGVNDEDVRRQFSVIYRLITVFFNQGKRFKTIRNFQWYLAVLIYRVMLFTAIKFSQKRFRFIGAPDFRTKT